MNELFMQQAMIILRELQAARDLAIKMKEDPDLISANYLELLLALCFDKLETDQMRKESDQELWAEAAKGVFRVADLFGDGSKAWNAEYAGLIVRTLARHCIKETPGPKGRRYMLAGEMREVASLLDQIAEGSLECQQQD